MTYNRPPSQPVNRSRPAFPSPPSLPQGYLKDGYYDENGNILEEVIISWPQQLAKIFHESIPQLKTDQHNAKASLKDSAYYLRLFCP